MINLKIRINVDEQVLTLPVDTQFIPGIPEKDPVVMVTEITEPEELKYLERDEWNIEELNFLAKRMESFDKREQSQFDAAVSIFRPKTVEALINYTYNLPRFTLISDFSTPNAIGVSHILNRKQVMSLDEMASTDFAKIGKELMQSGKGITTPYQDGEIVYENIPDDRMVAMDLALSIWDYTPEDLDLALNAAGTGYINTEMKDFELIELFDKPALFTNERLTKEDIPKGLYCYDLRTSDDGERFATIEPNVTVNHGGSIMPGADAYTEAQEVYATFPEFGFSMANEKYRTLEKVGGAYQFIANPNADKNERVHFIPVYVANGSYTVSVTATQIWTPAGMIAAVRNSNTLTINGTIYDDYYVGNK